MKKIIFAALLSILSFPAFAQSSGTFDYQKIRFDRERNVVNVEFAVGVSGRELGTTESWTITPEIRSGNTVKQLPPMMVNGNNKRKMINRERVLGGNRYMPEVQPVIIENVRPRDITTLNYKVSVPFEEWMRNSTLVLNERCIACSNTLYFTGNLGNINAPEPPKPHVIVPHVISVQPIQEEIKERAIAATAFIDFPVNRSVIQRDFRRNPQELDKIKTTLSEVKNNSDMTFKGIFLEGFASPDGPFANNERLARERVQALKNYVSTNFNVPTEMISTSYTAEDWVGLRALIEKSFIEGRDEILAIIDSNDAPDTKEARIKQLHGGAPWRVMLAEMMPGLRRTDYRVDFTVREYNVHDSREVLETNPSLLSHYELHALAQEFGPDSPQYSRIYGLIERYFPTDDNANLNVAAFKISRGDFAGAKINLDRIVNKTPEFFNNYGVVMMMQGKYNEALEAFRKAGQLPSALNNIREVETFLEVQREIESLR